MDIFERVSGLITIIIESKKAEEELSISNERYTLATKATNDAIWDRDLHTGMCFWGEGLLPAVRVQARRQDAYGKILGVAYPSP